MCVVAPFQDEGSSDPEIGDLGRHDGGPDLPGMLPSYGTRYAAKEEWMRGL
jgi:hypothetical protein